MNWGKLIFCSPFFVRVWLPPRTAFVESVSGVKSRHLVCGIYSTKKVDRRRAFQKNYLFPCFFLHFVSECFMSRENGPFKKVQVTDSRQEGSGEDRSPSPPPGARLARGPSGFFSPLVERGSTRSGARFAARNVPYYTTPRELLAHHQQLLLPGPVVSTRYAAVGSSRGTLLQTTIRFRSDNPRIREGLRRVFSELLRQRSERSGEGFEVVVTFNAILADSSATSFSLFYGHDFGSGKGYRGAHGELSYGSSYLVSGPDDVNDLPVSFDFEKLAQTHRLGFENSGVTVERFINVVYLVYQYKDGSTAKRRKSRREKKGPVAGPSGT